MTPTTTPRPWPSAGWVGLATGPWWYDATQDVLRLWYGAEVLPGIELEHWVDFDVSPDADGDPNGAVLRMDCEDPELRKLLERNAEALQREIVEAMHSFRRGRAFPAGPLREQESYAAEQ